MPAFVQGKLGEAVRSHHGGQAHQGGRVWGLSQTEEFRVTLLEIADSGAVSQGRAARIEAGPTQCVGHQEP